MEGGGRGKGTSFHLSTTSKFSLSVAIPRDTVLLRSSVGEKQIHLNRLGQRESGYKRGGCQVGEKEAN